MHLGPIPIQDNFITGIQRLNLPFHLQTCYNIYDNFISLYMFVTKNLEKYRSMSIVSMATQMVT